MATQFPIPPTYTLPVIKSPETGESVFNPIWLQWFLDLARILSIAGVTPSGFDHQALGNLQGGNATQRNHLSTTELSALVDGPGQAPATPALGISPASYQNISIFTQIVILAGGTGVACDYSPDNLAFYPVAGNWFIIARGHYLRVTYATVPAVTVFCL